MTISKGNDKGTNNQPWEELLSPSEEGLGRQNNILRRIWSMQNSTYSGAMGKLKFCDLDFRGFAITCFIHVPEIWHHPLEWMGGAF